MNTGVLVKRPGSRSFVSLRVTNANPLLSLRCSRPPHLCCDIYMDACNCGLTSRHVVVFVQYLKAGNTQYFCTKDTERRLNQNQKSQQVGAPPFLTSCHVNAATFFQTSCLYSTAHGDASNALAYTCSYDFIYPAF